MLLSTIIAGVFALGAAAVTYTEKGSGITFSARVDPKVTFGVALSTTSTTDFIGLIIGQGTGWAGISLGGPMTQNALLIAAWPNSNKLLASFRKTTSYASPAVARGTFAMYPIANGTYTNSTHFTYTFLCSKCIATDGSTFDATETGATIGWAHNTASPTTKTSVTTTFTRHNSQGNFALDIVAGKSAGYEQWSAYANGSTPMLFKA